MSLTGTHAVTLIRKVVGHFFSLIHLINSYDGFIVDSRQDHYLCLYKSIQVKYKGRSNLVGRW